MTENKDKSLEKRSADAVELTQAGPVFIPATDIYETGDAIILRCDMPGVEERSLEIELENSELTLTASQSAGRPDGFDRLAGEYETGSFRRTFRVPQAIDRDKIKAQLHNGVLEIELPVAAQAKPKKIRITTGKE